MSPSQYFGSRLVPSASLFRSETSADFCQQFPASFWVTSLLAHEKPCFCLAFSKNTRDKIIEKSLHTGATGTRGPKQRFVA